jgi:hypothetical protein
MFCPKCGQRNEGNYKFCRGCGENLNVIPKAMERRWLKLLNRALDAYIRRRNRKLPADATSFHRFRWIWFILIGFFAALGVSGFYKKWWWITFTLLLTLLANLWDYARFQRLSASGSGGNRSSAHPANRPDSAAELSSAPTTNELQLAPMFSVAESTTRRLEPITAAEKRSGDLL